jgi:GTP cyclohydrolase I
MKVLPLTKEEKLATIAEHFEAILNVLGLDTNHPSLARTPERVAKMYVEELFAGLDPEAFPSPSYFDEGFEPGSLIEVRDITVQSTCEHHFLPFIGTATISYRPKTKILGLSKINRIVDYFARRPQLQERLTQQIADSLSLLLETDDIAVRIEAKHLCVAMRGASDHSSLTVTEILRGTFRPIK